MNIKEIIDNIAGGLLGIERNDRICISYGPFTNIKQETGR